MYLHTRYMDNRSDEVSRHSSEDGSEQENMDELYDSSEVDESEFDEQQLESAIDQCKADILASMTGSQLRAKLVARLVRLRLRLLRLREPAEQLPDTIRQLHGHQLRLQSFSASQFSCCDHCARRILGMFHSWYLCEGCQFRVHATCVEYVRRTCSLTLARQNSEYELRICPESGLGAQKFRCSECKCFIPPVSEPIEPGYTGSTSGVSLLCDYSGQYYCSRCHWTDTAVIPARVLQDWDWHKYPVCRASRQFLGVMSERPVLNLLKLNRRLFTFVDNLRHVDRLRQEIMTMKEYLLTCRAALDARVLLVFGSRQYFVESSCVYSMRDLHDVHTGALLRFLVPIHRRLAKHIREDCQACRGKGHICDVCSHHMPLFAFDERVYTCTKCLRVVHLGCQLLHAVGEACCRRQRHLAAQQLTNLSATTDNEQ